MSHWPMLYSNPLECSRRQLEVFRRLQWAESRQWVDTHNSLNNDTSQWIRENNLSVSYPDDNLHGDPYDYQRSIRHQHPRPRTCLCYTCAVGSSVFQNEQRRAEMSCQYAPWWDDQWINEESASRVHEETYPCISTTTTAAATEASRSRSKPTTARPEGISADSCSASSTTALRDFP